MHFVGLGHSHVVALAKGAYSTLAKGADLGEPTTCSFHYLYDAPFEPPFEEGGGALNRTILDVVAAGSPRFILASMGGNEHNVLSIPQAPRRFDFILSENLELPLDQAAEIIPESAIRETLRSWMREKTDVLVALRAETGLPIYQIEPPPPLPRELVLAYPKEFFRSLVDRRTISSDMLRYKMWRAQSYVYREICGANGIEYVAVPRPMINENGMLIDSLCGQDASHANEAFGEAMVREVMRRYMSTAAGSNQK